MTVPPRLCLLLILAAMLAGCQPASPLPATMPPRLSPLDESCAERLHDLGGQLLLYHAKYGQLPDKLEALASGAKHGVGDAPLVCPSCGKPYVYNPQGVALANRIGRIILYDPEPCHGGVRLALLAEALEPGKPLILHVLPVTERAILWPTATSRAVLAMNTVPEAGKPQEPTAGTAVGLTPVRAHTLPAGNWLPWGF